MTHKYFSDFFLKLLTNELLSAIITFRGNEEDTQDPENVSREPTVGVSRSQTAFCIPSEPER